MATVTNSGLWSITIAGLMGLERDVRQAELDMADAKMPLAEARKAHGDHTGDIFDKEGPGWAELRPMTVRRRGGSSHPILDQDGTLRAAATGSEVHSPEVNSGYSIDAKSLTMWVEGSKAQHNSPGGFTSDEGYFVPQREFWPWTSAEEDVLGQPFESWADNWFK